MPAHLSDLLEAVVAHLTSANWCAVVLSVTSNMESSNISKVVTLVFLLVLTVGTQETLENETKFESEPSLNKYSPEYDIGNVKYAEKHKYGSNQYQTHWDIRPWATIVEEQSHGTDYPQYRQKTSQASRSQQLIMYAEKGNQYDSQHEVSSNAQLPHWSDKQGSPPADMTIFSRQLQLSNATQFHGEMIRIKKPRMVAGK